MTSFKNDYIKITIRQDNDCINAGIIIYFIWERWNDFIRYD